MGQVAEVQWYPPEENKQVSEGSSFSQGIWWGASAACGRRQNMEDAFLIVGDLGRPGPGYRPSAEWANTSVFGVFDGHAGTTMATFCEQNFAGVIARQPTHDMRAALVSSFHQVDQLASGYDDGSGTTALICCLRPDWIHVANAGDSRAVLCRAGVAVSMSTDHKPSLDSERDRIEAAGGWVTDETYADLDARVNGDLSVSRGIGDFAYKQEAGLSVSDQIMTSTPDVEVFQRNRTDEFMIVASDGIWDVLDSAAAVDWVRRRLGRRSDLEERLHNNDLNLSDLAEGLIDHCLAPRPGLLYGYGEDNMTVMVIVFVKSFYTDRQSFQRARAVRAL